MRARISVKGGLAQQGALARTVLMDHGKLGVRSSGLNNKSSSQKLPRSSAGADNFESLLAAQLDSRSMHYASSRTNLPNILDDRHGPGYEVGRRSAAPIHRGLGIPMMLPASLGRGRRECSAAIISTRSAAQGGQGADRRLL